MKVGVFYSLGPHFRRALERVRVDYPAAEVTAIIPPGFAWSTEDAPLAEDVMVTELGHYAPRTLRANLRLIARIRRRRFGVFIVLFDSFQLQVLAGLSGAKQCHVCLPQGRLLPVRTNLFAIVLDESLRRVWGALVYATLWLAVRLLRVRSPR